MGIVDGIVAVILGIGCLCLCGKVKLAMSESDRVALAERLIKNECTDEETNKACQSYLRYVLMHPESQMTIDKAFEIIDRTKK